MKASMSPSGKTKVCIDMNRETREFLVEFAKSTHRTVSGTIRLAISLLRQIYNKEVELCRGSCVKQSSGESDNMLAEQDYHREMLR